MNQVERIVNELSTLQKFVSQRFDPSAVGLLPIGAGMFSQAYRFDTVSGRFVLRIGVTQETFEKDKLAYERLGQVVPIPKILDIGIYDQAHFYALSEWQPGRILTEFSSQETRSILSSLFANLFAISHVQVPTNTDFGLLNGAGRARKAYKTWAEFIGAVDDFRLTFTPRGDEVYQPWEALFDTTFLDKALVLDARQRLNALLPLLPNERHYIHGDFGYDNALSNGEKLTAILDWAEMRCGDWLYDLAYLAFNDSQQVDYIGTFESYIAEHQIDVPNLHERIQAYYLHIWLGNVFIAANRNMRDLYEEDMAQYRRLVLHVNK